MIEKNVYRGETFSLPVFQENTGKFIYEQLIQHSSKDQVILVSFTIH